MTLIGISDMSKDDDSNDSSDLVQEKPNVKATKSNESSATQRYYKQKYRKAWEKLPEFNGCLEAVPGNSLRALCKVCNRNIHAHRLTLLKHIVSIKHMKLAQKQFKEKQILEKATTVKKTAKKKGTESEVNTDSNQEVNLFCEETCAEFEEESPLIVSEDDGAASESVSKTTEETVQKSPITTHVLDTSKGIPVPGLPVSIYQLVEGRWTFLSEDHTNPDGRCANLLKTDNLKPGRYKLHFDTDKYFELRNNDRLFPFIEIAFDVRSPTDHLHIPLLMSPYGYTTYRGS